MAGDSLSPNLPGLDLLLDFSSTLLSLDIRDGLRARSEMSVILGRLTNVKVVVSRQEAETLVSLGRSDGEML